MASLLDGITTLDKIDVAGKRVLLRLDLNVPLRDGAVGDALRIEAALPTIEALRTRGARTIIAASVGRPDGFQADLVMDPIAADLASRLGTPVPVVGATTSGPDLSAASAAIGDMHDGDVVMLDNLRFDPRETAGDDSLAQELAALADVFVHDAFGLAHRDHASLTGVTRHLPSAVGLLMQTELDALGRVLDKPTKPFATIMGGAKISDKLALVEKVLDKVDALAVGGAMCFTFLKAEGYAVGASRVEDDMVDTVRDLMRSARAEGVEILLPTDIVVADSFAADASASIVLVNDMPAGTMGLDVGPETVLSYGELIKASNTVMWNGPMGVFEWDAFAGGTRGVADALAAADAYTVIGGGDSAAAARRFGVADAIDHVSTGGGATLTLIEQGTLVALEALRAAS